jgi:sialic acid synthase SpsE
MVNINIFKDKFLNKDIDLYFIAEIGINHNGSYDMAKKYDR